MPEKVTTTIDQHGHPQETKVHPSIREAADHAVKKVGKPSGLSKDKIARALEGEPLPKEGVVTYHENGTTVFRPVTEDK